jgi:hypothetical protein
MDFMYKKLSKTPALSKQEFLHYILQVAPQVRLLITTNSGSQHSGLIVNVGHTQLDGGVAMFQLYNSSPQLTTKLLHIALTRIESLELPDDCDSVAIASQGSAAKSIVYTESNKIEVQRKLKNFTATILSTCKIDVGIPFINLPTNALALGRILKLTTVIQHTIEHILLQPDALQSWQHKYNSIMFKEATQLAIVGVANCVEIHFSFNNVDSPEINEAELTAGLMQLL